MATKEELKKKIDLQKQEVRKDELLLAIKRLNLRRSEIEGDLSLMDEQEERLKTELQTVEGYMNQLKGGEQ